MFSPRTHASRRQRAVITTSNGSTARMLTGSKKPRPPKQGGSARRQVVTRGLKLNSIAVAQTVAPAKDAAATPAQDAGAHSATPAKDAGADAVRPAAAVGNAAAPAFVPRKPALPARRTTTPRGRTPRTRTPRLHPSSRTGGGGASGLTPRVQGSFHAPVPPVHTGPRLVTPARRLLEPKVMADEGRQHIGKTPRQILVERVRRSYHTQDLEALLLHFGVDCTAVHYDILPHAAALPVSSSATFYGVVQDADEPWTATRQADGDTAPSASVSNLAAMLDRLPLEAFDDTTYDIHTNEEWAGLIPVAEAGFAAAAVEPHRISPLDAEVYGGMSPKRARATPSARPASSASTSAATAVPIGRLRGRALRPHQTSRGGGGGAALRAVRAARSSSASSTARPGTAAAHLPASAPYAGEWVQCAVEGYDAATATFTVAWQDQDEDAPRAHVTRLRLCFAKENPERFAQRVAAAFRARKAALARLQYNLYVDSMPLDGVGSPSDDQIRRITAACMSSPRLKGAVDPSALLYEVKLDWQRSMNRVLFEAARQQAAQADADSATSRRERLRDAAAGKLQVTDPTAFQVVPASGYTAVSRWGAQATAPAKGLVDSHAPPFAALSSAFAFNTCLTQPEIVAVLTSIHMECDRVRQLALVATDFPRSMQLEDFRTEQWKWIGSRCDRLKNDWVTHVASLVVNGLAGIGKGWFNIYETDMQVFQFSKLHRLLRMIQLVMQDTLRDLVDLSLDKFVNLLRQRLRCHAAVVAENDVRVEWPEHVHVPLAATAVDGADESKGVEGNGTAEQQQQQQQQQQQRQQTPTPQESEEAAERQSRRRRVRDLLRPPPLFEVELKVPDHRVLLNRTEVEAAHAARKAWKRRQRAAAKAAARAQAVEAGLEVPNEEDGDGERSTAHSDDSSLPASHLSFGDDGTVGGGHGSNGAPAAGGKTVGFAAEPDVVQVDVRSVHSDVTWGTSFTVDGSSDGEDVPGDDNDSSGDMAVGLGRGDRPDREPPRVAPQYGLAFTYSQTPADFLQLTQDCITKMLTGVGGVKVITPLVMRAMSFTTRNFIPSVVPADPLVVAARNEITSLLAQAAEPLTPYLRAFDKYLDLLNMDVEASLKELRDGMVTRLDLPTLVARITHHRTEEARLKEVLPKTTNCGAFTVNVTAVRNLLVGRHTDMAEGIMAAMADHSAVITDAVQEATQKAKQRLRTKVRTIEELTDLRTFMRELQQLLPSFKGKLSDAVATRDALETFCYRIDRDRKVDLWQALEAQELLVQQMRTVSRVLDQRQEAMAEDMLVQQSAFKDQLERLDREIKEFNNLTDLSQLENNYRRLRGLEVRLSEAERQVQLYNSRENLFGMPVTPYRELVATKKTFLPFQMLWTTAHRWTHAHRKFVTTPVMELDAETVTKETSEARSKLSQCVRLFFRAQNKKCVSVTQEVKTACDGFAPVVTIITSLLTKGMRERHWDMLTKEVGFPLHPQMAVCFPELMERGIANYSSEIVKVARVAAREYELEESLNSMDTTWKELKLQVVAYKSTGTFILRGVGELMALMDEHLTATQAMQFSAYKKPFEEAIDSWTKRLALASEVVDEWVQVQKAWLYLAPIFDGGDIAEQLPTEAKRFATVDMNWRRTLAAAASTTDTMGFLAREKLLQKFKESMRFLNTVQKGLADYLESKRVAFPRFYFLSNDDLLQILSQTKEVGRVQDHLSKCFEGVHRVQFTRAKSTYPSMRLPSGRSRKSLFRVRTQSHLSLKQADVTNSSHIIALMSRQGERVPLQAQVQPRDRGVEVWMAAVEDSMRLSVKEVIREAMLVHGSVPRHKWMLEWPGMAVLTASQIHWTANVETALKQGPDALREVYNTQLAQLNAMVKLVRGSLSSLAALCVGALAVVDVHARDVVERLIKDEVADPYAFEWIRNLRYYWSDEDVFVEMVTSRRQFGHEYLGNSFRLVVTPLTEKCYITCMTALDLTLGGAPAGPAGTGKTETVKDLAKALGKQCVVFNCSEGLDYLAMGKFFKGLAFCGAWACFDEFNRIDVEVLSVVAQQIITLQSAVRSGITSVAFEGTDVEVSPQFSVFVTMNPGYAGRTELPGNLKALFRPVAMMVPDYALIGEIMFFAYGFANARDLARKMVSTFQLCSEQLSNQAHYDYGMRAVKSVIGAAGKLRKQNPDKPEHELLYRALHDVNVPKFLAQDLPLFRGIVSDLFPGLAVAAPDTSDLQLGIRRAAQERHLQPTPYFMDKCLQLHQTLRGRHGVMVVGPSGGGKSESIATLARALAMLAESDAGSSGSGAAAFRPVRTAFISPKAITMGQLYGQYDDATREWIDGVLAHWVRTFAAARTRDFKWIVCDGPVDADWIENLNTALDDNKKLCLASGQIIQLPPELNIVFEAENLDQASPATVSRCGMVFHEPQLLGTDALVVSWLEALPQALPPACKPVLAALFDTYLPATLELVHRHCATPLPANSCQIVQSLLRLLDCAVDPFRKRAATEAEAAPDGLPRTIEAHFIFALIWSAGAVIALPDRPRFSAFLRAKLASAAFPFDFPDDGNVHDYQFLPASGTWVAWAASTPSPPPYVPSSDFADLFVPTPETVVIGTLLARLLDARRNVLLLGPTGTGKSMSVMRYLSQDAPANIIPITFAFSARTTSRQLQHYVEDRCEKRKRNEYGPPIGSRFVTFLDDLNLPRPETYGAQPPIELLRQWLTYGGWHDMRTMDTKHVVDTSAVAAMGYPGGGRHAISNRLPRHFNIIPATPLCDDSKHALFGTTLASFLTVSGFHTAIQELAEPVTRAVVALYKDVCQCMLPTPSKQHYTFNLRDLSKLLAGILMADKERIADDKARFLRLVVHEARRVLQDRLADAVDRQWFDRAVAQHLHDATGMSWSDIMVVQPANAANAGATTPTATPVGGAAAAPLAGSATDAGGDEARGRQADDVLLFGSFLSSRGENRYEEATDIAGLVPLFEEVLTDYNLENRVPMRLVMFMSAISHVCRILRVLRLHGNALLLGVGGSGRQSSTKLATFMAEYSLVQISVNKGYSMQEWHEDVKRVLLSCGLDDKPNVLLVADTQIVHEAMLEDVSNLLNSGDVPGLYTPEELDQIMEASKFACQLKGLPLTKLNLFAQYIARVRRNLHIVLAMTPVGSVFRERLRMFPALVNCCTINWFSSWPAAALKWVAEAELGLKPSHGDADDDAASAGLAATASADADTDADAARAAAGGNAATGEAKGEEGDAVGRDGRMADIAAMVPVALRQRLVSMFNTVHQSCLSASDRYLDSVRRHNYVTPACYLEFLRVFRAQLVTVHREADTKQHRLEAGLAKLEYTGEQVTEMRESLIRLRPQLEATQKDVDEMMEQIHEDRVQADATQAVVAEEEALAQEKAEKTRAIADDAQRDLDAVLPLLDQAVACLNALKRADLDEVRSMQRPPLGVQVTMEAACIMFGVKPVTRRNAMGQSEASYWEAAQQHLLRDARGFLQRMFAYDRDHIPAKTIKLIEPYIDRPEFQPDEVDRVNKASAGICLWVRAMYHYHQVLKAVEPKKASLAAAQAELDKVLVSLADAKARLKRVTDHVDFLQSRYNDAVAHKESLAAEIDRCAMRLESAQKLMSGLGSEAARWRTTVASLHASKEHLLGDVVVAAGTIAYLGPFNATFRGDIVETWRTALDDAGIAHSVAVTLSTTLRDSVQVREWRLSGLPADEVSTENGIIMHASRRSPVMVDPQLQANAFIKQMGEKQQDDKLEVVKPGDANLVRTIENAIRYGRWLLLEDVTDTIDPSLVALLACNTTTIPGASGRFLRVGEAVIPYNPEFRLFLTTTLANPHFSPEVYSNATVLDFTLTASGLEEQLLRTVISREMPALEDRKVQLAIAQAGMEAELRSAENKILSLLGNTTEGHLLDDTDLIQALNRAKGTAQDIQAKIKESAETRQHIESNRDAYRAIASRAAAVFFTVYALRDVDPMYQFSLTWFKRLFDKAIVSTKRSNVRTERIDVINTQFTHLVFQSVCRALFERHKLMFAFLVAVAIRRNLGHVPSDVWRFLLSGQAPPVASRHSSRIARRPAGSEPSTAVVDSSTAGATAGDANSAAATPKAPVAVSSGGDPPVEVAWLTKRAWEELGRLSQVPAFRGVRDHVVGNSEAWEAWAARADVELDEGLPGDYGNMTRLQRMCIIRAVRPDGVVAACQRYIEQVLGAAYLSPPSFNLEESYATSAAVTPLVFITSPGTDPLAELHTFATNTGMLRNLHTLSLGQGQGDKARQLITTGAARGHWLLLMNCHLYTSWMDTLRSIVEGFRDDNVHRNFRLWLTSEPTATFPVAVLQRSVKMTMERPTGLRANLLATYHGFTKELFFEQPEARTFAKLLYGLCFFHASIVERRRFGALGWNKSYDFSESDLAISRKQLEVFLGRYSKVPFKVLNEMAGGINYGGRITDDKDLRTVDVLLRTFFTPEVLEDDFSFSASGTYTSLRYDDDQPLQGYLRAIRKLPVVTDPEAFAMHPNASVMVALGQAYNMFDTILAIQPRDSDDGAGASSSASGGATQYRQRTRIIAHSVRGMLRRLPPNFDAEAIALKYPVSYDQSMNVVLVQEVVRYNALLEVMRSSLQELHRATKGQVVMSSALEDLGAALFNQWVPKMWQDAGYPSLKPLGAWEQELLARIAFLQSWASNGMPSAFWLSGFCFPQAFLTGTLQNYARKHNLAIDTLSFSFTVRDDVPHSPLPADLPPPEDGCYAYGLFLEGARWDTDAKQLAMPEPRSLFPALPLLHLLPSPTWRPATSAVYRCPVYKTLARQGTLSTTGHSTNFVMWLELPAQGTTIFRPALVSEVGAALAIGDSIADTKEFVQGGAAAFCSLRY